MMDRQHCLMQSFRALRAPTWFAYPESLKPAVETMAQAIADLPVDPHIAANMYAGLVQLSWYIGDGCSGYKPPVELPKPVPPVIPVPAPETPPAAPVVEAPPAPVVEAPPVPVVEVPAAPPATVAEPVAGVPAPPAELPTQPLPEHPVAAAVPEAPASSEPASH